MVALPRSNSVTKTLPLYSASIETVNFARS